MTDDELRAEPRLGMRTIRVPEPSARWPSARIPAAAAKGRLGWTNDGRLGGRKVCFDARPHLYPLPQERKSPLDDSGFAMNCPANPVAGFAKGAAHVAPSPWGEGRDEGGRETIPFGKRFSARRRKRQPGRARSPAKSQPGGQRQFGVDERGKGRLNTYRYDTTPTGRKRMGGKHGAASKKTSD